ncbi:hypothetical protein RR48_02967 [Papilio machaon]|uniref:GDNF/GAS1 domain-containing protein n=1 Tax=Papilio machaon TaxID=76193 RepID=A0A0N1PIB2_PAPMA|nr:hypothetical protein RR48_02967 [Papilio machaon]
MAILNCLLARQLCFEDASCSAILEIIPRVCGSELGGRYIIILIIELEREQKAGNNGQATAATSQCPQGVYSLLSQNTDSSSGHRIIKKGRPIRLSLTFFTLPYNTSQPVIMAHATVPKYRVLKQPNRVACSTVTVTKCQAALRTLQAFPFFKPTCLCREPNVDPECNSFRDFLFDHPCVFVLKKEKDPYPVETLPTCTYALSVCHSEKPCSILFERFKNACKAREGECRMEDREACREAWSGLRLSPLFGCICPNTHMKKRCDRIFAVVNHNPCVGEYIFVAEAHCDSGF